MSWKKGIVNPRSYIRSQLYLSLTLLLFLLFAGLVSWFVIFKDSAVPVATTPIAIDNSEPQPNPVIVEDSSELALNAGEIQGAIDEWLSEINGEASVVVADSTGKILASANPDEVYFAASIYKLYVAYEGYRQVDSGEVDPDELYQSGQTRAQCLDMMIRESDSPCAEKLWAEIGKQKLTDTLVGYGITNTSMTSINTTAADAANMLARISRGEGLSAASRLALLESMRNQIFRNSLNKGFSEKVTVYNKIGFRETIDYHDTAIIELESGEQIIVSILTENVGSNNIANLAKMLEPILVR